MSAWLIAGASVRGASHERTGVVCQDASRWRFVSGPRTLIAAAADGAGSAPHSDVGAQEAVEEALRVLELAVGATPDDDEAWVRLMTDAARAAALRVREVAQGRGLEESSFASTLLVLAISDQRTSFLQIGDGAIVWRPPDGVAALTRPSFGEHINETTFLTSPNSLDRAQVGTRRGPAHPFAMLTDGLEMLALKMPQGDPHAPFFEPLFRLFRASSVAEAQASIERFLGSEKVRSKADDDLTLVVGCPAERVPASTSADPSTPISSSSLVADGEGQASAAQTSAASSAWPSAESSGSSAPPAKSPPVTTERMIAEARVARASERSTTGVAGAAARPPRRESLLGCAAFVVVALVAIGALLAMWFASRMPVGTFDSDALGSVTAGSQDEGIPASGLNRSTSARPTVAPAHAAPTSSAEHASSGAAGPATRSKSVVPVSGACRSGADCRGARCVDGGCVKP